MRPILTALPAFVVLVGMLTLGGLPVTATATPTVTEGLGPKVLRINLGPGAPDTLDPLHSDEGQWSISGGLDYEVLTRFDENAQIVPGAAESWEFSPDGMTLTFHLRDGLVFSDGVPVTAEHFRYAAGLLCTPALYPRSAHLLFDVIGCEDLFNAADDAAAAAARAKFGVHALDDRTLEYQFKRPAPYFLSVAAIWGAIPLRQDLVEAGGPDWWKNPATRIGNGPFRLLEYDLDQPDQRLIYGRNDAYWGGRTRLDGLEFSFLDTSLGNEAYRNGEVDVTYPGEQAVPGIEADPILSREFVTIPDAGTDYFNFNQHREPFQDPKVREAFAYAFDRDAWCRDLVFSGTCLVTLSMIPPGLPGHIDTDAYAFNPAKARQALADSTYGGPENLPPIVWYGEKDNPGSKIDAEWYYQQFHQVLGVDLQLVYLSGEEEDALYDDPATSPQFHESAWFGSTDPRGWLSMWRCDSELNDEGYCNPLLDAQLDRADAELDPEQRIALYEEAGRMLVADAPAVFAQNISSIWLVKPYVTGYPRTTGINGDWPGWMNLMTVDVDRPG